MTFIDTTPYTHDGAVVMKLLGDLTLAAYNSLLQTPMGLPDEHLLWHAQPIEDCCSGLYVWVREWVPVASGSFPMASVFPERCVAIDMDPRVVISLRRPCAPMPDEQGHVDHQAEGEAAENLIIDARALTCGIFATWPPILQALYPTARISYGTMTPTGGGSECLGLDWELMLELSGCRGACS